MTVLGNTVHHLSGTVITYPVTYDPLMIRVLQLVSTLSACFEQIQRLSAGKDAEMPEGDCRTGANRTGPRGSSSRFWTIVTVDSLYTG
jgi:hypothetical protein